MPLQRLELILCLIAGFILLHSSCKKEKSPIQFSSISSGTDFNLYSIQKFSGDTLIVCGGNDDNGIILRSADQGTTWNLLSNSFDQGIYDVYFLNNEFGFASGARANVFKTTDGGNTWEKIIISYPNYPVGKVAPLRKIIFVNDSTGFLCGGGRFEAGLIYKTSDRGNTWSILFYENELRGIHFFNSESGVVCGYGIVLETTDGGNNWNPVASHNEYYTGFTFSSGKLWACGYNGGIYKTTDEGNNWQTVVEDNNAYSTRTHFNCITSTMSGIVVAAGADGIISISKDDGNSWNEGESFDGASVKSIILNGDQTGIAVGVEGKIFRFSF